MIQVIVIFCSTILPFLLTQIQNTNLDGIKQIHRNIWVCVWQNHIIDCESKFTYKLSINGLCHACSTSTVIVQILDMCFLETTTKMKTWYRKKLGKNNSTGITIHGTVDFSSHQQHICPSILTNRFIVTCKHIYASFLQYHQYMG